MAKKYVRLPDKSLVGADKRHKATILRAKGYSNARIAEILGLSEATIANLLETNERT